VLRLAPSKLVAYTMAMVTAREVFGNVPDLIDRIYILWGLKISESALRVDLVFRPSSCQGGELLFENITDSVLG